MRLAAAMVIACASGPPLAQGVDIPQALMITAADGAQLTGYLFKPLQAQPLGAVILMHGRAGAYSSLAAGRHDATTLSQRHVFWGRQLAAKGYAALLIDGFSARGYGAGFPRYSYAERPDAVNEVTVRPFDAYAALAALEAQPWMAGKQTVLLGWSNGGSATLAALADDTLKRAGRKSGFAGGIALYPGCGLHGAFDQRFHAYAPLMLLIGESDEEVSPRRCARLAERARADGSALTLVTYPGASHAFDDPGTKRQSVPANRAARADAIARIEAFLTEIFGRPPR